MYILAPSILAADFKQLGKDIQEVAQAGAQYIHIDVMDGTFVPSISFGMPVISSIRSLTNAVFDVHLMISEPDRYIEDFAKCGADIITVHAETCTHLDRTIMHIKEAGLRVGIALNPATPLHVLEYIIDKVDMVLIMSVNPGFGGQKYIETSTRKIIELRKMIADRNLSVDIEVDGGINKDNIKTIVDAGANIIVVGSSIFGANTKANAEYFMGIMNEYN